MRKINGVPVEAHTDLSNLTGGEVLKWDATNTLMAWEDQDSTGFVPVSWYGDRGVFAGGAAPGDVHKDTIDYIDITTTGNATDFGNLSSVRKSMSGGASSGSRGVFGGGGYGYVNIIEYITISTPGNATDFGDLTTARGYTGGCSDGTTGLWGGGTAATTIIDYITISTPGNATDFGDLTVGRRYICALSNDTRGVWGGGNGQSDVIDYVTIATTGNATDFGNLIFGRDTVGGCSDTTRGIFVGGYKAAPGVGATDIMDYITIASTSNATDFGDLTVAREAPTGASNATRGVFGGGTVANVIDYVTIQTTGDATDFGDLTVERAQSGSVSGD